MNVVKVDQDVAHVAYFLQEFSLVCFDKMFHLFQTYDAASVLSGCYIGFTHMLQVVLHTYCKCFIWILHMFYTHIGSVLSGCCICFTYMLQQYVSNVSSVSDVCCIQVFYVVSVSRWQVE
jgi:hypothetical protein